MNEKVKTPSLLEALIPVFFLVAFLGTNVVIYGDNALGGANQIILLLSAALAGLIGLKNKVPWKEMLQGMVSSITSALPSIFILLIIGSLAGTWMLSGIVPAMIYYGLEILNPTLFLFATCIICSIVSIATGSSWTTVATVGIALFGIGQALGLGEGIIAGAIISGAYFGDKMSPLSDTTNLAPAMAGTDLITHIRYMAYTTIPSISIALIAFLIIGFIGVGDGPSNGVTELQTAIASKFNIHLGLFLVPLAVVAMIVRKIPPIPALLVGTLLGGASAFFFQPELVKEMAGVNNNFLKACYIALIDFMATGKSIVTGNALADELLSSKGMEGMLGTIWLIVCAMCFGGVMEAVGLLKRITDSIIGFAQSTGSLVATTTASCLVFNVTASDQYLSIVVPGRMFADEYKKRKLHPKLLSRTLEDSGTVTSALVPWNTCGAYHAGVLGVATGTYLPYCFFNLISPFMTVAFAYFGIKIAKLKEDN